MIYLIEYDRPRGHLLTLKAFDDVDRVTAEDARLEMELDLHRRKIQHEVVLLEASSEEALRRTHRRYFETPGEILQSALNLTK